MAGPINGIGVPQLPSANTFQPGQNTQVREEEPRQDATQAESVQTSELDRTNAEVNEPLETQQESALRPEQSEISRQEETPRRGSTVDVLV